MNQRTLLGSTPARNQDRVLGRLAVLQAAVGAAIHGSLDRGEDLNRLRLVQGLNRLRLVQLLHRRSHDPHHSLGLGPTHLP